ncbi:hypothetical protein, partial [Streptosporangium sp. V21-05]|uniref:hypothetical protein n=1 Tax=Streptosporangium sp. V21-05 TaxID=3446115 RepID=UPI003F53C157
MVSAGRSIAMTVPVGGVRRSTVMTVRVVVIGVIAVTVLRSTATTVVGTGRRSTAMTVVPAVPPSIVMIVPRSTAMIVVVSVVRTE